MRAWAFQFRNIDSEVNGVKSVLMYPWSPCLMVDPPANMAPMVLMIEEDECESEVSSQESADSTSASSEPDTESSSNASKTPIADESSPDIGPESRSMRTSMKSQPLKKLTVEQVEESIALYQGGASLAKVAKQMGVSRQAIHDLLKRRIQLRDRIEALPRKEQTAIRAKRAATLKRYRSRAARITRTQIREVWERDQICQMCGDEGEEIDHIIPVSQGGQTELMNLRLLCKPCHTEKSRTEKGVVPMEASQSIYSAEASRDCAKTSPLRADEQDSQESDRDCSSSSPESLTLFSDQADGSSLRMFPDSFPQRVDEISPSYSRRWASSGFTTSLGECWTADTSECPSAGGASSSLPDVLEAEVHPRFYLSQRAAAGILRRAEKRSRELPQALESALRSLADTERGPTQTQPMPSSTPSTDDKGEPMTTTPKQDTSSPPSSADQAEESQLPSLPGSTPTDTSSPTPSDPKASTPQRTEPDEELHSFYPTGGSHGLHDLTNESPPVKVGSGVGAPAGPAIASKSMVRRLTPTECERLQGFPDGHTWIPSLKRLEP